ncbi:hypothetical protein H0H93_004321, partial [Arthromyces matolae]
GARCLQHIHKPKNCQNAPEDVRGVAKTLLMKKGGIESVIGIDSDIDEEEPSTKKAQLFGETATKKVPAIVHTTSMDSYLDWGMTQADENKANIRLLRYKALQKKSVDKQQVIAVCTDNPRTMQAFRRKWTSTDTNLHVIPLACFIHGINTITGKIVAYPAMKAVVSKNTCVVSFFLSLHYWGSQLETIATKKKITQKLKTNTESQFYVLILQALSVRNHKQALTKLCMRENAQRSMGGLTPVAADVVATVFDMNR